MAKTNRQPRNPQSRMSRQTGGTFLGFVLGLIVALSIAVVVALYITRSPTPFVAKNGGNDTSASAAIDNAQFDPNRILQGKSPSQPVAGGTAPAPAVTTAQAPATAPAAAATDGKTTQPSGLFKEPQIVEVPAAPAPATPSTDTAQNVHALGTTPPVAAAKPAASAAAAVDSDTAYYLQVGAYTNSQAAQQQRARLALQGFESAVSERDSGGTTYFRVRVGPFTKFDDMNNARQQLSDAGIHTDVMRLSKQQ